MRQARSCTDSCDRRGVRTPSLPIWTDFLGIPALLELILEGWAFASLLLQRGLGARGRLLLCDRDAHRWRCGSHPALPGTPCHTTPAPLKNICRDESLESRILPFCSSGPRRYSRRRRFHVRAGALDRTVAPWAWAPSLRLLRETRRARTTSLLSFARTTSLRPFSRTTSLLPFARTTSLLPSAHPGDQREASPQPSVLCLPGRL